MIILGIETSCDETAAAVLTDSERRITILSNVVASSSALQAKYGGVIPEQAAREQIKTIIPVIKEAMKQANCQPESIDAIAVTYGPGLIGSLLVGVETAKTLSLTWDKPLIPINHLLGHFYANWIGDNIPAFPCIGLLVSGGHTDLVLFQNHNQYKYLGGTRDDAAGECFDKCARILELPYPGGPQIAKLAQEGDPNAFDLPRPMLEKRNFSAKGGPSFGWEFSFSGLKTAVANLVQEKTSANQELHIQDLAASIEAAIVDVLVTKTVLAAQTYRVDQIIVAGGVAANQKLKNELTKRCELQTVRCKLFLPPTDLCTDNAAMIASAAFYNLSTTDRLAIQVSPSLSLIPSTNS